MKEETGKEKSILFIRATAKEPTMSSNAWRLIPAGEIIVVSSDREISSYVTQLGKTPLASPEFETIMNKAISSVTAANP